MWMAASTLRDNGTINLELIFSDIEILERRISKQSKGAFNNKELAKEVELLKAMKAHLKRGRLARSYGTEGRGRAWVHQHPEPAHMEACHIRCQCCGGDLANDGADNGYVQSVRGFTAENGCGYLSSALRLSRKSQSWMRMRRKCSWTMLPYRIRVGEPDAASYRILEPYGLPDRRSLRRKPCMDH